VKAFNVHQPWAELIISGRKKIEVRKQSPGHQGLIAVRSTKTVLEDQCKRLGIDYNKVPTEVIVGTVEITKVIKLTQQLYEDLRNEHLSIVPYDEKFVGWRLENPQRLKSPILYTKPLPGVFVLRKEIAEKIQEAQK